MTIRPATRLRSLDSVRGLAALVVVFYHASLMTVGPEDRPLLFAQGLGAPHGWLFATPLRLLVAGPAAVILFFVLSGFVLAIGLDRLDERTVGAFLIKRVGRVWLPFAASVVLSLGLLLLIGGDPLPGATPAFNANWSEPPTPALIMQTLLMTGATTSLNPPMWSLVHELRISLIFPLLLVATRLSWRATLGAAIVLTLGSVKALGLLGEDGVVAEVLRTATYVLMFVVGIILATHAARLRRAVAAWSGPVRGLLWLVGLSGLAVAPMNTGAVGRLSDAVLLLVDTGAAGLVLVLAIVEGRTLTLLLGPVPSWLGRISYSLYLTHVPVIVAVVRLTADALPPGAAMAIAVALALPVAAMFERTVERPAARGGRALARRWVATITAAVARRRQPGFDAQDGAPTPWLAAPPPAS